MLDSGSLDKKLVIPKELGECFNSYIKSIYTFTNCDLRTIAMFIVENVFK